MILAVALLAAAFASLNPVTRGAQGYAQQIATASAGTYLSLRTLNAFLSTAQEVEVGASAIVANGSAQPLKWLEPVDDTVERVAQVVFVVMITTGVLAVALVPASGLGWLMVAGAVGLAVLPGQRAGAMRVARRLGLYGVLLGAAIPLSLVMSAGLADRVTAQTWESHSRLVSEITAEVGSPASEDSDSGFFGALQRAGDDLERYGAMASAVYDRSDALVGSLIALAAIFIFKLLVLPMLLIGGMWVTLRAMVE